MCLLRELSYDSKSPQWGQLFFHEKVRNLTSAIARAQWLVGNFLIFFSHRVDIAVMLCAAKFWGQVPESDVGRGRLPLGKQL